MTLLCGRALAAPPWVHPTYRRSTFTFVSTSRNRLPPPTCVFGFGGMCNGEDRLHVVGQRFAKGHGVGRKSAAPVPLNCKSLSNRLSAMGYAGNTQGVSVGSLKRGDDRHTMTNLGQSKQCVRGATLEQDIGSDVCEAAGCVEQPADRIAGVQQQQRIRRKTADIYDARLPESDGWSSDSQGVNRRQDTALEAGITLIKSDAHMSLAAFEHGCLRRTEGFSEMYMYVGIALGISR
jgi:hypothetical protein